MIQQLSFQNYSLSEITFCQLENFPINGRNIEIYLFDRSEWRIQDLSDPVFPKTACAPGLKSTTGSDSNQGPSHIAILASFTKWSGANAGSAFPRSSNSHALLILDRI